MESVLTVTTVLTLASSWLILFPFVKKRKKLVKPQYTFCLLSVTFHFWVTTQVKHFSSEVHDGFLPSMTSHTTTWSWYFKSLIQSWLSQSEALVAQGPNNFIRWILSHYLTISVCAMISVFPPATKNMHTLGTSK